jgi:lipopolysaccharide export system protein LptA
MTADANTIDYKPLTNLAELTGGVKVVQAGRGESHSEHMLYNTDTGDMEAGDTSSSSRVHMVMEPKGATPAPRTDNCGFPGTPKAKKTAPEAAPKS